LPTWQFFKPCLGLALRQGLRKSFIGHSFQYPPYKEGKIEFLPLEFIILPLNLNLQVETAKKRMALTMDKIQGLVLLYHYFL